jgi:hypothetical protein
MVATAPKTSAVRLRRRELLRDSLDIIFGNAYPSMKCATRWNRSFSASAPKPTWSFARFLLAYALKHEK